MGGSSIMASAGRVLPLPKGAYSPSTTYHLLDFVSYQGSTYICKQTSTGNAPTNTTYWQIMAQGTESASVAGNYYGTCSTGASTSAKIVSIPATENFVLQVGDIIGIKFDNTNTANNPSLNVNNSGAKPIYYNNSAVSTSNLWASGEANRVTIFMYDGTNWIWMGHDVDIDTDTLSDLKDTTISSTSNGQVLMYDSTSSKWKNQTPITTLAELSDTQISSATDGQVLKYNSTSQKWENAEDTGGLLPHLIIISETGESVVKAVKGTTEIIATETSTGHYECDVPEFGTWTIHAVLNGDDATVNLVVDTVKVYTVDDSHFHATVTVKYPAGATCRLQSADETLYATGSPYTFTVHHAETYTITVTYNQRIYTDTVTFTTEGQSFSKTLPTPSDADANDINFWLWFGDVSGSYSSLADILADSTALATLMASTDAVDYLVRCTNWISDICGNQSAMSYIGLNNYCANTLLADSDWFEGICDSVYVDSVLNVKIPTMTSNTTPSGECYATQGASTGSLALWKMFDNDNSTNAEQPCRVGQIVGYKFPSSKKVLALVFGGLGWQNNNQFKINSFKIVASNDASTWEELSDTIDNTSYSAVTDRQIETFANNNSYLYYGLKTVSQADNTYIQATSIQFYGREDV